MSDTQARGAACAPGTLYVVATPIGNLQDVTLRALRVLREVDLVAAEDTRRTRVLLEHHGIRARLLAYHDHVESERAGALVRRLLAGESVALVSDAGTPLIADPGYRLLRLAADAGVPIVPVPGPCAPIALLSCAALPTDRFTFIGFLPARRSARRRLLHELAERRETLVFLESPRRLGAALADLRDVLGGGRAAVIGRELTKRFEEVRRDSLAALAAELAPPGEQAVDGER
ncbi:MAG: 16S rRNA (cytidine(1402)-2'-O)-methyltransferase, partial [Thermodesulfobacteriota bacterium]